MNEVRRKGIMRQLWYFPSSMLWSLTIGPGDLRETPKCKEKWKSSSYWAKENKKPSTLRKRSPIG